MKSHRYLWLGTAVLGFSAGVLARKSGGASQAGPERSEAKVADKARDSSASSSGGPVKTAEVSRESVEDLLAITDAEELYQQLALWMPEASEEDCIALFDSKKDSQPKDFVMTMLILSRWTQLNPKAAMAATKDTQFSGACWMAWANNDPLALFAYARGIGPKTTSNALSYIGLNHPLVAQRLMSENPGLEAQFVISSVAEGLIAEDPEAALELSRKHNLVADSEAIALLTRRDPHAALAWLLENPGMANGLATQTFIKTLVQSDPEELEHILSAMPSGALKRDLEKAKFGMLAESHPEEALRVARETESAKIATQRLSEVGYRLSKTDPAAALGVLKEIFSRYPEQQSQGIKLLSQMVAIDPEATMAAALENEDATMIHHRRPFSQTARVWAERDLEAFSAWTESQSHGENRVLASGILTADFKRLKRFPEAMRWATDSAPSDQQWRQVEQVFGDWIRNDAASAQRWIEEGEVPPAYQKRLASKLLPP